MTSSQNSSESCHSDHGFKGWICSRTGIVTAGALAILGFLVYEGHGAHLLGLVPYLFLLACPLMHIFMHGGHHHHHSGQDDEKGESHSHGGGCCGGSHDDHDNHINKTNKNPSSNSIQGE